MNEILESGYFEVFTEETREQFKKKLEEINCSSDRSFEGYDNFKEIDFEGKKYLVSENTLKLSNAILVDYLTPDVHKTLHEWGFWFLDNMVKDMAYEVAKKLCKKSVYDDTFQSVKKEEYEKSLNGSVKDLLDFVVREG